MPPDDSASTADPGAGAALEAALEHARLNEERLRFALDVAGLGQWDLDLDRGTAYRSLRHDQIFGYDALLPDWTYEQFLDHVLPEDREAVDAAFQESQRTGEDWEFECRIRRADGADRWIWARGRVWLRTGGGTARMLGVVGDVTERKARERSLAASEARFHRAIVEAPIPVFLHAEDGEMIQVSRAVTEITGYPAAELRTLRDWFDRAYGDDAPDMHAVASRMYEAEGRRDIGEVTVRTRSGDRRVWLFSSAPLGRDADGRRLVISMAADVTERKRAEADLRQVSARLVQVGEKERRAIARELHDELGGLLTSVQISLDMNPATDRAARDELDEAAALVHAMADKVRQLSLDLRPSLLDDLGVGPALDQLAERFEAQTRIAVDLHCEVAVGERFASEVETTAYRIVQEALTNVARHAGAESVEVVCIREPGRLEVHVIDGGAGFEPAGLDAGASTGVSSMRERAALVGGTFEIVASPGAGTRVSAVLPAPPAR